MDEIEKILTELQDKSFRGGKMYQRQCQEGLSGELSEYHALAEYYERQTALNKIQAILNKKQ